MARIATSGEVIMSIILDPMIGAVEHEFKTILNESTKYDWPNEHNL